MSPHEGRFEKRIRLAVALEVVKLRDPARSERVITENVCSQGLRVLARKAMEPNDQLIVRSSMSNARAQARVVYCQRLSGGRFALGLQFQSMAANFILV